jgi:putative transposase
MPRKARLDVAGTLHHVIVRGIEKRRIFDDETDHQAFVKLMGDLALRTETKIYGWSLLFNHVHLLLRSGPGGLAHYMRRLLTGYAQWYNRRHNRNGHLFQNRYKSIVCEEDVYFQELIRYIHLNPLRAGLVTNLEDLEFFPWAGHTALMGKIHYEWQDTDYVLASFGARAGQARKLYRNFLADGITQGRRPELVGGGLVRSMGGWSEVRTMRASREKVLTDERILGTGDFVENVLKEAEGKMRHSFSSFLRAKQVQQFITQSCMRAGISVEELQNGSRRENVSAVRCDLAIRLVREFGLAMAEAARQLGVSTPAISHILRRAG